MNLLVQSAMIFFGTLLAAGLVALGEPRERAALPPASERPALNVAGQVVATAPALPDHTTPSHSTR